MQNILILLVTYLGIPLHVGSFSIQKKRADCRDKAEHLTRLVIGVITGIITLITPLYAISSVTPKDGVWNQMSVLTVIGILPALLFFLMQISFAVTDLILWLVYKNKRAVNVTYDRVTS